jgi:hypothetical protein
MRLHRIDHPLEFVEELLRQQITNFTLRLRFMQALQWLSAISLITVGVDTFLAVIWGFHPIMPLGEKVVAAVICGGAIYASGWAMGYLEELRDDTEVSLEKLLFGEEADAGEGKGK